MDSKLYEELCRRYIAENFDIPLDKVTSPRIPNAKRPNLPDYKHQIDLYWESGSEFVLYLNIANAKWRGSERVTQDEVMLLQQVRTDTGAHKALLIAPTSFAEGARAAAAHHGIGLHIVRPNFDYSTFPTRDRAEMQVALAKVPGKLYACEVVLRGLDLPSRPAQSAPSARPAAEQTTRQLTGYITREGPGPGATDRRLASPPSGPNTGGGRGGGGGPGGGGFTRGGGGGFERR
jgi:uncharacterized membrane protein YgcG